MTKKLILAALKAPNAKIKIGDTVSIENIGGIYDAYVDMARKLNILDIWAKNDVRFFKNKTGTVLNFDIHMFSGELVYAVLVGDKAVLIDKSSIRVVIEPEPEFIKEGEFRI
jgi:hypothetical protein